MKTKAYIQFIVASLIFPLSIFYGIVTKIRNLLFDYNVLHSISHNIFIISVGNLRAGGTGKTPFVEFLLNNLGLINKEIAVLSRGYGRKTKGFRLLNDNDTAESVGDEPLQMYKKFNNQAVFAVGENRNAAIQKLVVYFPNLKIIILDDAFQHRYVKANVAFMLTSYTHPFFQDFVIPFGQLREYRSGYKRADYIVITKSPQNIIEEKKQNFILKVKPYTHQQVVFSSIHYQTPYLLNDPDVKLNNLCEKNVILITGIADNSALVKYLLTRVKSLNCLKFSDHYYFSDKDFAKIKINKPETIIMTTEKDAVRLPKDLMQRLNVEIYVIGIELKMDKFKFQFPIF
jgi:tetraacyldisaccharide 4'-kinase